MRLICSIYRAIFWLSLLVRSESSICLENVAFSHVAPGMSLADMMKGKPLLLRWLFGLTRWNSLHLNPDQILKAGIFDYITIQHDHLKLDHTFYDGERLTLVDNVDIAFNSGYSRGICSAFFSHRSPKCTGLPLHFSCHGLFERELPSAVRTCVNVIAQMDVTRIIEKYKISNSSAALLHTQAERLSSQGIDALSTQQLERSGLMCDRLHQWYLSVSQ